MFYIFYGDDKVARDEALQNLLSRVKDTGMGDLNTTKLDGGSITFNDLRNTCDALPFMGERRIVIVKGLLERFKKGNKDFYDKLVAYLPDIPDTTRLFFIEADVDKRLRIWKLAQELAEKDPPEAYVREFATPKQQQLPTWIRRRVHKKGGRIEGRAASMLAEVIGEDVRLLDSELEKLVNYAGDDVIDTQTVELLVPYTQQANIFDMVDAIGQRNAALALRRLQHLLNEDAAPTYLLHMIVRQIRLLLQFRELSDLGMTQKEIRAKTGQHPFVVQKGIRQAQNFTLEQLEAAFDTLLQTDLEIKTGQTEPALALELLVTELARRSSSGSATGKGRAAGRRHPAR